MAAPASDQARPGTVSAVSLQPLAAYVHLVNLRVPYQPDPALCRRDGWAGVTGARGAYRWMREQLARRVPPPTPDALPVWVWLGAPPADWDGVTGTHLTLSLDPARLLVTHYPTWDDLLGRAALRGEQVSAAQWQACLDTGRPGAQQAVTWTLLPGDVTLAQVSVNGEWR